MGFQRTVKWFIPVHNVLGFVVLITELDILFKYILALLNAKITIQLVFLFLI